jgi:hypothetical protein
MSNYTPQDIIDLVHAALFDETVAGSNVVKSRMTAVQTDDLPAISIYVTTQSETATSNEPDGTYRRVDTLALDVRVRGTSGTEAVESVGPIADDVRRRLIFIEDFRTDFETFGPIRTNYRLDNVAEWQHAVAEITIDLTHIYQYEPLTGGDAWTLAYTTVDIDEDGDAPDVEIQTDLTGGTP